MFNSKYAAWQSFLDMMFNVAIVFVTLFIMSVFLIKPAEDQAKLVNKAEFVISMTWEDSSTNDIDLWIKQPDGQIIYFRHKDTGLTFLDRDNQGSNNTYADSIGNHAIASREEIVTIRGFASGRWAVATHFYKQRKPGPAHVHVKMIKLNPFAVIFDKEFDITTEGQEVPVASFRMESDGAVFNVEPGLPFINEVLSNK